MKSLPFEPTVMSTPGPLTTVLAAVAIHSSSRTSMPNQVLIQTKGESRSLMISGRESLGVYSNLGHGRLDWDLVITITTDERGAGRSPHPVIALWRLCYLNRRHSGRS